MQKDNLKATDLAKEAKLQHKSPIGNPILCTSECRLDGPYRKPSQNYSQNLDIFHPGGKGGGGQGGQYMEPNNAF